MTARIFYEKDASLEALDGKTIVFVGYGNQGRAQGINVFLHLLPDSEDHNLTTPTALNLRDTLTAHPLPHPPTILIANPPDSYSTRATADNFAQTSDFAHAASIADILFLLVPDHIQPALFNTHLGPTLKHNCAVVVASGYNVFYDTLSVPGPAAADIVMLAPRMIGSAVRSRYVSDTGFPCFVSVERDSSGSAWPVTLALALAIGAMRSPGGVTLESSVREETLMDLFAEQALWPHVIALFRESYSVLKGLGCSDEALCHELWMSKEPAEVFEKCAEDGFVRQLGLHSSVSQYGQLKGSLEVDVRGMREEMERVARGRILGGEFMREFSGLDDREGGVQGKLGELYAEAEKSELVCGERKVRERLGLKTV
ncbi:hypothetical protein MMC16_006662 [Acarospora aff. strigata]|nr:hypothetical protein [Acarospora aff. strigata]